MPTAGAASTVVAAGSTVSAARWGYGAAPGVVVVRWCSVLGNGFAEGSVGMALLRRLLGDALRRQRLRQRRTLREVSSSARVSLGYLSEVERGQKEASSELLAAICTALGVRLADVLREVSEDLALVEPLRPAPSSVEEAVPVGVSAFDAMPAEYDDVPADASAGGPAQAVVRSVVAAA